MLGLTNFKTKVFTVSYSSSRKGFPMCIDLSCLIDLLTLAAGVGGMIKCLVRCSESVVSAPTSCNRGGGYNVHSLLLLAPPTSVGVVVTQ